MGFIKHDIEIVGSRKSKKLVALFDSGAYRNYMRKVLIDGEAADDIGFHIFEGTRYSILANGESAAGDWVRFKELRVGQHRLKEPRFVLMESLIWDAIIGVEVMQELRITLDPPHERIVMRI